MVCGVRSHLEAAPVRRSLFRKYFLALFTAVISPMAASGISDAWFGYRDQRAMLSALLRVEARSAAGKIQSFLDGIKDQLGWTIRQTRVAGYRGTASARCAAGDAPSPGNRQHHFCRRCRRGTAARLPHRLEQDGRRIGSLRRSCCRGSPVDRAYGMAQSPYRDGSEPFMTMAMAGNRKADGIVVAEINLKLIWIVVSEIRVGRSGQAFVVDQTRPAHRSPRHQQGVAGHRREHSGGIAQIAGRRSPPQAARRPWPGTPRMNRS